MTTLRKFRKVIAAVEPIERRRQAAYLYSAVQSGEESEDGGPSNVIEFGYDAGFIYAAKLILANEAGVNDWPADVPEFEEEIGDRCVAGKDVAAQAAEWLALRDSDGVPATTAVDRDKQQ